MAVTIEALYDGRVLVPTQPLELEPNTRVRIPVERIAAKIDEEGSFLDTAKALELDGPADWSRRVDAYHYGTCNDNDL